jgi:hypothetical protein
MLEASGDFELAETVAFKLAQQQPEHYQRINFLHKYPGSEFAEIVYAQTWRDIQGSGNIPELRSSIQVRPAGAHALEALDLLFALYAQERTLLGFQEFLAAFPNAPQAVKALEAIFDLAFKRALTHADKLDSVALAN